MLGSKNDLCELVQSNASVGRWRRTEIFSPTQQTLEPACLTDVDANADSAEGREVHAPPPYSSPSRNLMKFLQGLPQMSCADGAGTVDANGTPMARRCTTEIGGPGPKSALLGANCGTATASSQGPLLTANQNQTSRSEREEALPVDGFV